MQQNDINQNDARQEDMYLRPGNFRRNRKKWIIFIAVAFLVIISGWFLFKMDKKSRTGQPINVNNDNNNKGYPIANDGNVSPISGLACENWNRRPLAIMQPADIDARPAAGFSEADMVIEMPVITASITRLMGIYICNLPKEAGSMRSARHDFIHLAKGLDAIFVPWGRSESHAESDPVGLARGILDKGEIDNINCNADAGTSVNKCSNPESVCFRKEGMSRGVDSGYGRPEGMMACAKELGYRTENNFSGYPHQGEAPLQDRPQSGNLRVGFAGIFAVNYEYNRENNSYERIWGGEPDTDRNNGKRIAPKNIVVLIASSEQIEGQYNNVQLGDPWYDTIDSGEAYYYFNGKEIKGTWKKDRTSISSKLMFSDGNGEAVKFVPGQIWVEILEPGQTLKWRTETEESNNNAPTGGGVTE